MTKGVSRVSPKLFTGVTPLAKLSRFYTFLPPGVRVKFYHDLNAYSSQPTRSHKGVYWNQKKPQAKHAQHREKTLLGVVSTTLTKGKLRSTGTKNCLTRITLGNGDMRLTWCSSRGRNGGQRTDNCWSCWGERGWKLAWMNLGEKVSHAGGVILKGCPNVIQDLSWCPRSLP